MKKFTDIFVVLCGVLLLNSCGIVEGVFKAGMWTGFLIVALVVAVIIWIIIKISGGSRRD